MLSIIFRSLVVRSFVFLLCYLDSSVESSSTYRPHYDSHRHPQWSERNLNTIKSIYNLTIYPNNVPIIAKGGAAVPDGLFSQQATGRVSPVGNFSGFEDSIEYFFALAPTPNPQENNAVIYQADVVDFTSGCPNIASSLVYLRTGSYDNTTGGVDLTKNTSTLSQVAFWRFDSDGAVLDYQAWIPNLQRWSIVALGIDFDSPVIQGVFPSVLCPIIQQRCTGADQQYADTAACVAALDAKPFGKRLALNSPLFMSADQSHR